MPSYDQIPSDWPPPPRQGGSPQDLTEWGKLALGKTLGKSALVRFINPLDDQVDQTFSPVNLLEIRGGDTEALQLCLTIPPLRVLPTAGLTLPANLQSLGGPFQDNQEVPDPNLAGAFEFVPGTAQIQWGIGGASCQVDVDIGNGVTINLSGSFVRVQAGFDISGLPSGAWGNATPAVYQLTAFLGPGQPRAGNCRKTIPVAIALANNASSPIFRIPRFARKANITAVVNSTFVGTINWLLGPTTPWGDSHVSGNQPNGFDIPGGAQFFYITNTTGSLVTYVAAVFELYL